MPDPIVLTPVVPKEEIAFSEANSVVAEASSNESPEESLVEESVTDDAPQNDSQAENSSPQTQENTSNDSSSVQEQEPADKTAVIETHMENIVTSEGTKDYGKILRRLLQVMIDNSVSDMFVTVGVHPIIRVYGDLVALSEGLDILTPDDTEGIVHELLATEERREKFKILKELDFSFAVGDERFRVNVFRQKGYASAAVRYLPAKMYSIDSLGLPEIFREVTTRSSGVILVAGPTGSGKSTTLSAMIDEINSNYKKHIITIEDPIEYVHKHKKCIIEQREVGEDTESFSKALRSALRENPDVVLVGEMRDLESIRNTLTLAETGHLVFATIHSRSSAQCITKIVDSFPAEQQNQVRLQLAEAVVAIFNQRLLRNVGGNGYVLVTEVMIANNAIRNLIRENKIFQVNSSIQMGQADGMHLLEDDIVRVIREGRVTKEEGVKHANDPTAILRAV